MSEQVDHESECLARWQARGLGPREELAGRLARLMSEVESSPAAPSERAQLLDELGEAASPREVMSALERALGQPAGQAAGGCPGALERAARLAGQGTYPSRMIAQHPELMAHLAVYTNRLAPNLEEMTRALRSEVEQAREQTARQEAREAIMATMRAFKRRVSLTTYLREVEGKVNVRETTTTIAHLAIASLRVALEQAAWLRQDPASVKELCVLGMGKLGGLELNYSSDVDLILVCRDAAFERQERRGQIEGVAREMIALMEEVTSQGYVFRVDLRLRPEGSRGLLVQARAAMVEYYLSWGRTWERSAMLKASPVAGALDIGWGLLEELEPFLYRRYLDFQAIDDLREMKEMVNRHAQLSSVVGEPAPSPEPTAGSQPQEQTKTGLSRTLATLRRRRRGGGARRARRRRHAMSKGSGPGLGAHATPRDHASARRAAPAPDPPSSPGPEEGPPQGGMLGWDVKIGVGGIREIEFFVQALQLVHCGTRPDLRVRNTLEALDRLLYAGLISHEDHAALGDAYDLYRRVEHRVQMAHDRQDHRLPSDPIQLEALARRMGLSVDELGARLQARRAAVSRIFARLFHESARLPEEPTLRQATPLRLETVLAARGDELFGEPVRQALSAAGFVRPRQIAGQLHMLRQRPHGPFGQRAAAREQELARYLLEACAATSDADRAFGFITRLITTVGDRGWFWKMLSDNPHATRLLIHVFGSSEHLAGILLRDPNVIGRLLSVGSATSPRPREETARELREQLDGLRNPDHRRGRIHRFQQEEILRLALHEFGGAAEIEVTTRQLADLAEVVLAAVLQEVWSNLRDREIPEAPADTARLPFCVLGMGKLGGAELGFGSDLDLIFVYEPHPQEGLGHALFARLAQRLVRALSALSEQGRLYEVDTRLRPSGRQGTLVVSAQALESYHTEQAGLWERQALLRARPLTGPVKLRARLGRARRRLALQRALEPETSAQMTRMRQRMLTEAEARPAGLDVKHSRGGIIDLEFLTQRLQLALAQAHPELPPPHAGVSVRGGARVRLDQPEHLPSARSAGL